jgi:hypothetical protein
MASTVKHLRSSTASKRPTASGLAEGQLAINTASGTPGLFLKDSAGTVVKVGPVHVGASAPNAVPAGSAGNSTGELWVDNSATIHGLNYYTGSAFVNLTPSGTATVAGLVELATDAETQTGTDTVRAVTPSGLQSKVSDSTSTTSSTTIASSTAVKAAYDLADAALPKAGGRVTGNLEIGPAGSLSFEGSSDDSFETTLAVVNPTANRTITLPNTTGTVITTGDSGTVTSAMIADLNIVNADINASAAIADTKLATIATAGKVSNSATTATNANTASAIVARDASGNFSAGTITAAVTGAASSNVLKAGDTMTGALVVPLASAATPSLTFTGDLNTGIYSPGADQLALSTAGNGRLFIDGTGLVGIGTVPTLGYALDVRGLARLSTVGGASGLEIGNGTVTNQFATLDLVGDATYSDYGLRLLRGNSGANAGSNIAHKGTGALSLVTEEAGSITLATNNSERLRITSAGLVGIGTSAPTKLLQVTDSAATSTTAQANTIARFVANASNADANIQFSNGVNHSAIIGIVGSGANIYFAQDGVERMRIDSAGRVGIGTASPGDILSATGGNIALQSTGGAGAGDRPTERRLLRSDIGSVNGLAAIGMNGAGTSGFLGEIKFYTGSADIFNTTLAERARIDSGGRLLVGTSTYSGSGAGFEIEGTGSFGPQIRATAKGSDNYPVYQVFRKSRGASIVQNNDFIFECKAEGFDGSTFVPAAAIRADVDGTPGASDMPGRLVFSTTADGAASPTERLRITSAGNVGIGVTSPSSRLEVNDTNCIVKSKGTAGYGSFYAEGSTGNAAFYFLGVNGTETARLISDSGNYLAFGTGSSGLEKARIDSSGRLLVGTSSALATAFGSISPRFQVATSTSGPVSFLSYAADAFGARLDLSKSRAATVGTNTVVQSDDDLGEIYFNGADGTNLIPAALIRVEVDGTPGANDMPGRIVLSTTASGASSPTERMRIASNGSILFVATSESSITSGAANGKFINSFAEMYSSRSTTGAASHILFYNPNGYVGQISTTASATSYTTSSDYRLKENVTPLIGAIDRLQQIPVHRFNFIADPDTVVDGFIAHEAQEVVPECVTGTKDEVDDDGNPVYQGIDQSKLVPLLTAALQEAIAKIETLEARLTAAGL